MTAESNKRIMERFTGEFLTTGDLALAEEKLHDAPVSSKGDQPRQMRRPVMVPRPLPSSA